MLARTVENIYWLARYVERAENTARLISATTNVLLDLPGGTALRWAPMIAITGSEDEFERRGLVADERAVVQFLIADPSNPGSIVASLRAARENARTLREVIPTAVWEQLNHFYHEIVDEVAAGLLQRNRFNLLKRIVVNSQALAGVFDSTASRNDAWAFVLLGRNLERADMTSRILDVRFAELKRASGADEDPYELIQWMSVLKSLSGYQMYRLGRRTRVARADVLDFLLRDGQFPRSCAFCLREMTVLLGELPRADRVLSSLGAAAQFIGSADLAELDQPTLQSLLDEVQLHLKAVHQGIAATYFPSSA
jgi:uncharacterized alpha-E superfamily protein